MRVTLGISEYQYWAPSTYRWVASPDRRLSASANWPGDSPGCAQPSTTDLRSTPLLPSGRGAEPMYTARAARRVADSRPKWLLLPSMRSGSELAPSTSALMTGSQPSSRYFFISLTSSP